MNKVEKTHKLWQSMINTDLTPDEFIKLQILGRVREQSLRQLVSYILRQEIKTFSDIIEINRNVHTSLQSLEAGASPKRQRGRPRLKDAKTYTKSEKEATLPASMLTIIEDQLKE